MRISISAVVLAVLCLPLPAAAQDEASLRNFFEGRRVTLKLEMPATSSGVDVHVQRERPIDFRQYGDRVKSAGVSIREGETVLVTLVKLKKDLIEFQLAGGGYNGDSGYVAPDYIPKSNLEKQLEKDVKAETDAARRRRLQQQLDDERNRREREQARANAIARRETAMKQAQVADERLRAGSRFNLRWERAVPANISPNGIMELLGPWVDFSNAPPADAAPVAVKSISPADDADGMPRKGMLRAEAEREFGKPEEVSDRKEGTLKVTTLVFLRGDMRISAEFIEDVLIRYTISSR